MDGALERGGGGGGRGGGEASPEQQVTEPSDAHVEKAAPEKGEDGKYGCQRQVGPCRRGGRCSRDGCRSWSWCVQVGVSSTRFQSKTCHSHCECWECLLCCEFLKSLVCRPRLAAKATAPLFSRGEVGNAAQSRELGSDHNGNWSRSVLMPGYIRLSPPIGRSFLRSPRLQTADMRLKQYTSAQGAVFLWLGLPSHPQHLAANVWRQSLQCHSPHSGTLSLLQSSVLHLWTHSKNS
ncbi:uncharacterized protein LOC115569181 isoform X4 [Sparus aurata]|uniref:uncharacterized protein LOC115569181 isoform X4 n=1 Tax=Sparus aurata TaxID=8175 RepID=UPI0011C14C03|nr:uncharacterized protein LOC115569181 isoform X4 [Sparus aurata]